MKKISKYTIIAFMFFISLNSCLGQYPRLGFNEKGKVVNKNQPDLWSADSAIHIQFYDGQKPVTIINGIPYYLPPTDTVYYYGKHYYYDTIVPPKDNTKAYFHKFIYFTNKMNSTRGKQSARFEDSAQFYYKLLYPQK